MKPRWTAAVIGAGFIGPVHVEGLRRAGVDVIGVLGSTPEKSLRAAAEWGVAKGYASLDDVLADDAVKAVHVASPNRCHFEQAARALQAGKHVLCEKPLAMNSSESRELVRIARESGRAAGVAYNVRYYPLCQEASARVRSGSAGDVWHVQGSYAQDWLCAADDFNWRVLASEGGELRAMADIGTHWLDLVQFITGQRVAAVCADLRTVHPKRRHRRSRSETFSQQQSVEAEWITTSITTEDCGSVMLRFANGANGCLWVSQTTAGRKNCLRFELGCAGGSFSWNSESPEELWIGRRGDANQSLLRDPALLSPAGRASTSYPGGHAEGYPDTFKQLFRAFYGWADAIERGESSASAPPSSLPTFADGHGEIQLCEAILASHRGRCWQNVATES